MIINNIFQTYYDSVIPTNIKNKIEILKKINNNFNYFFFTNDDCLNFIKNNYNKYLEIYLNYPHFLQRENIFKLLIVYHYGGFFFDTNFLANKNIEDLQKYSCVFPEEKEISNKIFYKKYGRSPYNLNELKQIGIYAFGAEKGHPLLLNIIDEISNRYYDFKSTPINLLGTNILIIEKTTGSDIISIIYHSYSTFYDNIKILKGDDLIGKNPNKCCPPNWYKFGIYGEFFYSDNLQEIKDFSDSESFKININKSDSDSDSDSDLEIYNHKCIIT